MVVVISCCDGCICVPELKPVGHGAECPAGAVSAAVGSMGLGHAAGRGRRGQPGLGSVSAALVAYFLGCTS